MTKALGMKILHYLKRAPYYMDVSLFWMIFRLFRHVFSLRDRGLLDIIRVDVRTPVEDPKREGIVQKVSHYLRVALIVRSWFFRRPCTCFMRSVLLCRLLRDLGVDARVNFGTGMDPNRAPQEWPVSGHCWVGYGPPAETADHPFIFQLP
jgi:hypothetical protein